jgi:hypothetical protein
VPIVIPEDIVDLITRQGHDGGHEHSIMLNPLRAM